MQLLERSTRRWREPVMMCEASQLAARPVAAHARLVRVERRCRRG